VAQHRLASGGIAGQVNAFVIIQNLFAVGEMENIDNRLGSTCWTKLGGSSLTEVLPQ